MSGRADRFFMMPRTASNYIVSKALPDGIGYIGHSDFPKNKKAIATFSRAGCRVFCFIRNPLDRLYSAYRWFLDGPLHESTNAALEAWLRELGSFEQVVMHLREVVGHPRAFHFYPQHQWIFDGDERLISHIGLYDRLHEDLDAIAEDLGFEAKHPPGRLYTGDWHEPSYRRHYTEEMKKVVLNIFARDFDLWLHLANRGPVLGMQK